jgi:hypothetical protein
MLARFAPKSAPSRRATRVAGAALGVAVIATALSACERPLPQVSVLSGSTVVRVSPQTYIFTGAKDARVTSGTVASLNASGGTSLLVDVPREVADQRWNVSAITLDAQGKATAMDYTGASSPTVTNTHSTRVVVPYATGAYYLKIASAGNANGGVWLVKINITA